MIGQNIGIKRRKVGQSSSLFQIIGRFSLFLKDSEMNIECSTLHYHELIGPTDADPHDFDPKWRCFNKNCPSKFLKQWGITQFSESPTSRWKCTRTSGICKNFSLCEACMKDSSLKTIKNQNANSSMEKELEPERESTFENFVAKMPKIEITCKCFLCFFSK